MDVKNSKNKTSKSRPIMKKVVEKIKLDTESFENVSKMLNSPNEKDNITALMAMEQIDFRKNQMFLTLLYKNSIVKQQLWKINAPNLQKNLIGLGLDEIFSYRSIWNKLKDSVSKDEKKMFMSKFSLAINEILTDWGFKEMIKDFTITIKLKNDE